jgi:hypothetical protein
MAEETGVKDAALSLFALGRGGSSTSSTEDRNDIDVSTTTNHNHGISSSFGAVAPPLLEAIPNPVIVNGGVNSCEGDQYQIYTATMAQSLPSKNNVKPKDPRRDTSVPFDEMQRLMRVYGSLKCLRNRQPVDSSKATKAESIKRKFYRWFPDLDERFCRTEEGWYVPKAGHEEEMRYREMKRRGDQDVLVKKRATKRMSSKQNTPPLV